jgi:hypothetical protein
MRNAPSSLRTFPKIRYFPALKFSSENLLETDVSMDSDAKPAESKANQIFVGNLPFSVDQSQLAEIISSKIGDRYVFHVAVIFSFCLD